jgi:hypothetical protein
VELKNFYAQDANGNIIPGATCTLYLAGTTTLATGLEGPSGSPLGNPFTADINGLVAVAAPQGVYDLVIDSGLRTGRIEIQFIDVEQVAADALSASASAASAQSDAISAENSAIAAAASAADSAAAVSDFAADLADTPGSGLVGYSIDYAYPAGYVGKALAALDIGVPGAIGNGVADDTAALQARVSSSSVVVLSPGKTYKITGKILADHPVIIDLNGSTVQGVFTTQVPAFDVQSNHVRICKGSIIVNGTLMGGYGGSLNCVFAGNQTTGAGWYNLRFHDLTVSTNRNDAGATIGIIGECYNVVIENIKVPDNSQCRNIIGVEWGGVPTPGGTGHPHDITIRNVECGKLTFPAVSPAGFGYVVWLSGSFNVTVENISAEECFGLVGVMAGDRSKEFAPDRYKNMVGTGFSLKNASTPACFGYGLRCIGKGQSSTVLSDCNLKASGINITRKAGYTDSAVYGAEIEYCTGFEMTGFKIDGCDSNFVTGPFATRPVLKDGEIVNGKLYGAQLGSSGGLCIEPVLNNVKFKNNNANASTGVGSAAVSLTTVRNPKVLNCTFGDLSESENQRFSISVGSATVRPVLENNHTNALAAGGTAYVNDISTNTTLLTTGGNNTSESGITNWGGAPIFRINRQGKREFLLPSNAAPTTGDWVVEDTGWYPSPASGGFMGVVCVTAGTPGTWRTFGAISAS